MKTFTGAMALAVALALTATPALPQGKSDTKSSDTTKSSEMKSSGSMKSSTAGGAHSGASMSGNAEQVKAVQQALKDQGHDPGAVDGVMGPKTQAELRDYQQKQGLKVTGRLDADTSAKLGVEKSSSAPSSTSPAASPSTSAPPSSDTKASKPSK
jgi:peptidoglycan hydrolase-like protein with peptidoglycan-binding domain